MAKPKIILFVSSGGSTRINILRALKNSDYGLLNINQISNKIGMQWGTVKYEIELLKKEGLIEEIESDLKRTKFYRLTEDGEELFNKAAGN
ncbi:MAG: winged helix-turn-helix domain-containing protein [Candidatus Hydrothermarchaeota archaeon]